MSPITLHLRVFNQQGRNMPKSDHARRGRRLPRHGRGKQRNNSAQAIENIVRQMTDSYRVSISSVSQVPATKSGPHYKIKLYLQLTDWTTGLKYDFTLNSLFYGRSAVRRWQYARLLGMQIYTPVGLHQIMELSFMATGSSLELT